MDDNISNMVVYTSGKVWEKIIVGIGRSRPHGNDTVSTDSKMN